MDADSALNIFIKLGFIGQDQADAAKKAITDAASATGDYGRETGKAGEAAKEAGVHFENNRRVFTEIDRIAPGMGEAVRAAFEGPLGAVILLTIAINEVREKLADYNKELDEVEKAEIAEHEEAIHRLEAAWDDAAKAMGDYYAKMATAGQDNDPEGTQIKRIKEQADAEVDSSKKVIRALGEQEQARLRASGASPDQLAAARERTAEQLAALDEQRDRATGLGLLLKEQSDRQANNPKLQREAISALDAASAADKKFDSDQAALENARALTNPNSPEGAALQKRVDEANENLETAKNAPDFLTNPLITGGRLDMRQQNAADLAKAQQEADAANSALSRDRALKEQLEQSEHARVNIKDQADENAANAKARSVTNQKRLVELPGEISQAQTLEQIKWRGDGGGSAESAADKEIHNGQALADFARGGISTGAQNDQLMQIASRIAGHSVNLQTAVQIMENGMNNMGIFMEQVNRLAAIFSRYNPGQIQDLLNRVDTIERQGGV